MQAQTVRLRYLLETLPPLLPILPQNESAYGFTSFQINPEWAQDVGKGPAVNRAFEVRLGSRENGLKLRERGPELVAVVDVIEYWLGKFSNESQYKFYLDIWLVDLIKAAEDVYKEANIPVSQSVVHTSRLSDILIGCKVAGTRFQRTGCKHISR